MTKADAKCWLQVVGCCAVIAAIVATAIYVEINNYSECRKHGFNAMYCLTTGGSRR